MARKIRVISCAPVKSGTTNGRDWTKYEVVATKTDGTPIEEKLIAFEALAGEVDVEVTKKEDPKYGTSYTLQRAGSGSGNPGARLGPKVDELATRLTEAEQHIADLTRRVAAVEQTNAPARVSTYGQPPADTPAF